MSASLDAAAEVLARADLLLITAGAGLGVDGGLGTFRGLGAVEWPGLADLGIDFPDMSCPDRFAEDDALGGPATAWAFWKWRADAYSQATLHEGYSILERWALGAKRGSFVFTSNIDGHFRRLGAFQDHLLECHGTIDFLQCQLGGTESDCSQGNRLWPTPFARIAAMKVDHKRHRVVGDLPRCPGCGRPARPAVLMFGDLNFSEALQEGQRKRKLEFLRPRPQLPPPRIVVLELGAGVSIPTVRRTSESWALSLGATLIRVNPEYPEVPSLPPGHGISLHLGALEALKSLDHRLAVQ